jgi:single-strand DNA-binding protein
MNCFNFIGRLGKDGELRSTNSGDKVLSFSVAVEGGYADKKVTTWMECQFWGKRADAIAQYVRKGDRIGVSGEFSMRAWTDNTGNQRQSPSVRVNDVTLLGEKREAAPAQSGYGGGGDRGYGGAAPATDLDDTIPF